MKISGLFCVLKLRSILKRAWKNEWNAFSGYWHQSHKVENPSLILCHGLIPIDHVSASHGRQSSMSLSLSPYIYIYKVCSFTVAGCKPTETSAEENVCYKYEKETCGQDMRIPFKRSIHFCKELKSIFSLVIIYLTYCKTHLGWLLLFLPHSFSTEIQYGTIELLISLTCLRLEPTSRYSWTLERGISPMVIAWRGNLHRPLSLLHLFLFLHV